MQVQHNTTGIILTVISIKPKTVYMQVAANPNNVHGIKVGQKQKTSPQALTVLYTTIKP